MVGLHTKNGSGKVAVHPKSVNCRETHFESKWLVFYHMLKTTQVTGQLLLLLLLLLRLETTDSALSLFAC